MRGDDPGRFIRALVEEKGWKRGNILEVGAGDEPAIPNIDGFKHFVMTLNRDEAAKCRQKAPFATVLEADAAALPFGPLGRGSCNVIFWRGAMLHYVKLFNNEIDLSLFQYEKLHGRRSVGTYQFLRAISETMKKGGLFVELYPFLDFVEVPVLFTYLELPMKSIQFVERRQDHLSKSEKYYLFLRSIFAQNFATVIGQEAPMSPERELANSPFSAMVIEK